MKKNTYSLILMDEVVQAIDQSAARQGTSRSSLINSILAEYAGLLTPEVRVRQVFEQAERSMESSHTFHIQPPGNNIFSVKSAIRCKYNPAIRYRVEIIPSENSYEGALRVSSRTQNSAVLSRLHSFFEVWSQIEENLAHQDGSVRIKDGRFERRLQVQKDGEILDANTLGNSIGAYIKMLDNALNHYFSVEEDEAVFRHLLNLYHEYQDQFDDIL